MAERRTLGADGDMESVIKGADTHAKLHLTAMFKNCLANIWRHLADSISTLSCVVSEKDVEAAHLAVEIEPRIVGKNEIFDLLRVVGLIGRKAS